MTIYLPSSFMLLVLRFLRAASHFPLRIACHNVVQAHDL